MVEIPRELIERYSTAVPRYTSYPTAVEFRDSFGARDWSALLGEEFNSKRPQSLSLYVHIPFCRKLCYFCACNKIITEERGLAAPYVKAVIEEMKTVARFAPGLHPVEQIHWGGGSPNFLSPEEMMHLHTETLQIFPSLERGAEVSVELDPRTTTTEQLIALKEVGFNRISFGVQDFDEEVQETVNRVQSFEETQALAASGRELGFEGINLDLIYGLPQQTLEGFGKTLEKVVEIRPDRIALYGYAHVTWIQKAQNTFRRFNLPTPEERISLFLLAVRELQQAGYQHIGLDHFALPSDSLHQSLLSGKLNRNFMGYTTHKGASLLGFGASSISTLRGGFAQNEKDPGRYQEKVLGGKLAVVRGLSRTAEDIVRGELIELVLCGGRIDYARFTEQFGVDPREVYPDSFLELEQLEEDGLVSIGNEALSVTDLGRFFARNIASAFDGYLAYHRQQAKRVFSQAI
jgi:oxygen-independent coproporphyrinogen-3 oxidase